MLKGLFKNIEKHAISIHKQYHDNILGVSEKNINKVLGFLYACIFPFGYLRYTAYFIEDIKIIYVKI